MSSLTAIGTPEQRPPRRLPAAPRRASAWSASSRARSANTTRNAFSARVEPRDPLEVQLDELARGDLAGGDQLGLAGDPGVGELDGVHRARNLVQSRRAAAAA